MRAGTPAAGIKRNVSLPVLVDRGTAYPMDPANLQAARSKAFDEPMRLPEGAWTLPRGAYGESCGPV